ncbi:MAG: ribonuclease H [Desulfobacterales bacterium]
MINLEQSAEVISYTNNQILDIGEQKSVSKNQKPEIKDWKRVWFKNNKAWMATDPSGGSIVNDGRVLIKYQLKQDYEYWVNTENIRPIESPPKIPLHQKKRKTRQKRGGKKKTSGGALRLDSAAYADKICIFTDGASSGNPGPSGIGVLLRYGQHEKEISKFIGYATNNIAELKAIEAGLLVVKDTSIPVRLFTDSNYAYGVLVLNWKARRNQDVVESIKKTMAKFKDLVIIKIKGHAGDEGNERADYLATSAIKKAGT